jgi:hypothetical protein
MLALLRIPNSNQSNAIDLPIIFALPRQEHNRDRNRIDQILMLPLLGIMMFVEEVVVEVVVVERNPCVTWIARLDRIRRRRPWYGIHGEVMLPQITITPIMRILT